MSQRDPRESALRAYSNNSYWLVLHKEDFIEAVLTPLKGAILYAAMAVVGVVVAFTPSHIGIGVCLALGGVPMFLAYLARSLSILFYGISTKPWKPQDILNDMRANGTLEALLEDFSAATPAPDWMGKHLRFGKHYLFKKGEIHQKYENIRSIYVKTVYNNLATGYGDTPRIKLSGKEHPIVSQRIMIRVKEKSWELLPVPLSASAQEVAEQLLPLFQQGNSSIRISGQMNEPLYKEETE